MRFDDCVAIVTGSTSGIGLAIAEQLSTLGCTVVINSVKSAAKGEKMAERLPPASYCQADIADESQCKALINHAIKKHGRLDVLINNAGYSERVPHGDLDAATDDLFNKMWQINFMGTWYLSRAAMPYLEKSNSGHIINISSIAGMRAAGSSIPYAVSKAAVNHLTKMLANSCGPNVKVNAIAPGFVTTPRTENWQDSHDYFTSNTALKTAGAPEDIAKLVVGILSSNFITGEVIVADGGFKLG